VGPLLGSNILNHALLLGLASRMSSVWCADVPAGQAVVSAGHLALLLGTNMIRVTSPGTRMMHVLQTPVCCAGVPAGQVVVSAVSRAEH
jgi:hypothetical protein